VCPIPPTHVKLIAYFNQSFMTATWLVPTTIFEAIIFLPSRVLTWLSHRLVRWAHLYPVSYFRGSVFESRPNYRLSQIFAVILLGQYSGGTHEIYYSNFDRIYSNECLVNRRCQDHSKEHAMSLWYHEPRFAESAFTAWKSCFPGVLSAGVA
jgi:hypothetical protein